MYGFLVDYKKSNNLLLLSSNKQFLVLQQPQDLMQNNHANYATLNKSLIIPLRQG